MRWLVVTGLVLSIGTAAAQATAGSDVATPELVSLYAHWRPPVAASFGGTVVLDELFPEAEPDLSEGPLLPGAEAAGTLPHFTYALTTWYGDQGPLGTVPLDDSRPAVVTLFLSADQTPWPSPAGRPPADVDIGVAPRLTVEVDLRIGTHDVGHASLTKDLVSLPGPAGETVHRFDVVIGFEGTSLAPGQGLFADITLQQLDAEGERVAQNLFNLHTGEKYPTGVALPITDVRGLYVPDDVRAPRMLDDLTPLQGAIDEEPGTVMTVAATALGGAIAVAGIAGGQLLRSLRRP